MTPTPAELRREVAVFIAAWMLLHPEDVAIPEDIMHEAATKRVLMRYRPAVPQAFLDAFGADR